MKRQNEINIKIQIYFHDVDLFVIFDTKWRTFLYWMFDYSCIYMKEIDLIFWFYKRTKREAEEGRLKVWYWYWYWYSYKYRTRIIYIVLYIINAHILIITMIITITRWVLISPIQLSSGSTLDILLVYCKCTRVDGPSLEQYLSNMDDKSLPCVLATTITKYVSIHQMSWEQTFLQTWFRSIFLDLTSRWLYIWLHYMNAIVAQQ